METLPNELIINILEYLPLNSLKNICVTSKNLENLCKEIKIKIDFYLINVYHFINCVNFCSKHFTVTKIILSPPLIINDVWMKFATNKLKTLKSLVLHTNVHVTKNNLENFFNFSNIEELSIYNLKIIGNSFEKINKLTNLKKLKIRSSLYIDYDFILSKIRNLQELSLIGTSTLDLVNFDNLKNLRSINFSASEHFVIVRHLSNKLLSNIAENCKFLEKLNLGYCRNIDPSGLNLILEKCNIKYLRLQCYENLNQDTLKIIGNLKNLSYLDISHCRNMQHVQEFKNIEFILKCSKMKKLYAFGISYVDDIFFSNLGRSFPLLTSLLITFTNTNCKNILTKLSNCKKLNKLFLRGSHITSEDFKYFASNTRNYNFIDLGYCKNLESEDLNDLDFRFIKILDINSPKFTKQTFKEIFDKSPYLHSVRIYYVNFLDIDFLKNICKNVKNVFIDKVELNEEIFEFIKSTKNIKFL